MPLEPESDLHWKAFLYVSGELTVDESMSFERLLAEDQEAREAVALAVELTQALAIVGPLPRSVSRKWSNRRVLAWAGSMAAAACLAVAIVPILRPVVPTESQGDTSSVALAWSGLRVGPDADWTAFVSGVQTPVAGSLAEIENADETESSTERPLPSWLLSAASVPSGESPQEEN